ncbi:MAG TPA: response regulator [Steroidobacteraceae bacterium]|nr:response regulator [Steroidobacteraceae bacterium]
MSAVVPAQIANQKILVVDDNAASLYATVRILKAAGFDVIEADTGLKALEAAEHADIGLIVLDINLPDIDGLEVCRRLRARSHTAYLPVVHLSATHVSQLDMTHGLSAGGDSYLTHPVDPPVLIATVRTLLFARQADIMKRTTDARFRTIFELASSGIALLDPDLVYRDVNPEFCRLAARERSDIIGKKCVELIAPGHEEICGKLHATLADGGRWEGMMPVSRPDGSVAEVEWRIVAENGHGVRIAIATNVTERERMLESERAARAEAERSNRLKDEFLATLSHELRNPLNAMLGWASVLRRKNVTPQMIEQGLDAIERNSRIQSHLIEDLLDFAGIRFGKMRLDVDVVPPARAIEAAAEVVATPAANKNVSIELHVEDREAHVMADESRLQQVVWNLLTNAIKFTPNGGRIDVYGNVNGDQYEIAVTDTGRGISAEFLPQIFERFSQQESGTGKSFAGLGIGLTIVKHLVDIQHGTIDVASEGLGKGATFRVRLPLTEKRPSEAPKDQATRLRSTRALVVEDDPDARALIVRILTDAGAQVTDAANAEAAISQIKVSAPDVLVSDIGMAQLDGYQLLRNLRSSGYDADKLPAIALTAFSRTQDRADALDAGFQAHLAKPVRAEALITAVANLTRKK